MRAGDYQQGEELSTLGLGQRVADVLVNAALYTNRAYCLDELGRYVEALLDSSVAIAKDSALWHPWAVRSAAWEHIGDFPHAREVSLTLSMFPCVDCLLCCAHMDSRCIVPCIAGSSMWYPVRDARLLSSQPGHMH